MEVGLGARRGRRWRRSSRLEVEAPWGDHPPRGPVLAAVVLGGRREAESEREEELAGGACLRPGHG